MKLSPTQTSWREMGENENVRRAQIFFVSSKGAIHCFFQSDTFSSYERD